ncbi:MAG: hypothetical protein AAGK00_15560 [Pseudomonadota bacterium]
MDDFKSCGVEIAENTVAICDRETLRVLRLATRTIAQSRDLIEEIRATTTVRSGRLRKAD